MANKKKRTKKYSGSVAAIRTSVTKVSAVKRNPIHQYWIDHRQFARPVGLTALVIVVIILVIIGIVDAIWH